VWTTRLVNLQDRQEGFLGDLDRAHLLHPTLSFFLFLEQLALAGDVATVALGRDVLAQGANRFPGDHLGADRRLDHHLEQLPRDQLAQLLGDLPAPLVRLLAMDDAAEGAHRLPVDQCGMRLGFSTNSSDPSVRYTWYSTFGTVLIRSSVNSRSSRSRTISMCSRPRNPQRKPKPSATDDSGS